MGVKGRIAYIDYDREGDKYMLFVSREFSKDMAPWMVNGNKLLNCFREIYYNKKNHRAKNYKLADIVRKMADFCGYDWKDDLFALWPLERNKQDQVVIDLTPKYVGDYSFIIDSINDNWSRYFGNSDWVYIIPICSVPEMFIKSVAADHSNAISKFIALDKDTIDTYHFRIHDGSYNYIDKTPDDEREIEITEGVMKEDYSCKDECNTMAAPPLSTIPLKTRRFTEIIAQYKDGDRNCLVVRDTDNKHVLFKEMK